MNKKTIKLTTSQFAKIHHLNKRTLHYYDSIGLFSPLYKGENQYRYYDYLQGIDLEYILMLKELNMSLDEIQDYLEKPSHQAFMEITTVKQNEIEKEIQRLKRTQQILIHKQQQLQLCQNIKNHDIHIIEHKQDYVFVSPYHFKEENIEDAYCYINEAWDSDLYRMGIGSYISVDRIKEGHYDEYEGFFVPLPHKKKSPQCIKRPQGKYICAYLIGDWQGLGQLYKDIMEFANQRGIELIGYAYEIGLNEFAISSMEEYVTQIIIQIKT